MIINESGQKSLPICLFYGEEEFLAEEKINLLKSRIENPALNVESLDGQNFSFDELSSALQTAPMFGGDKLVIVRDFSFDAERQQELIPLLQAIPDGVKVVFLASNIDKRSKFYKLVNNQGEVFEFKTFAPWEQNALIAWIRSRAEKSGKKITEAAAGRLSEICGNHLRLLASEIEKLITYAGERGEIGEEEVLLLASPGEINAFALLDALREKNLHKSLSLFKTLFKNKEDLFQLMGLLATQYRLLLQIKSLPAASWQPQQVAGKVGASPYFVRKCLENIDHFTLAHLKENLGRLLAANLELKTGRQSAIVFELLLTFLCRN
jgi:DNA polymerase-3 subunit delta